jgi:hypothetical protein
VEIPYRDEPVLAHGVIGIVERARERIVFYVSPVHIRDARCACIP